MADETQEELRERARNGPLVDDDIDYESGELGRIIEINGRMTENFSASSSDNRWKYLAINLNDPTKYTDQQHEDQYMEVEAESLFLAERAMLLRDEMRARERRRPVVV